MMGLLRDAETGAERPQLAIAVDGTIGAVVAAQPDTGRGHPFMAMLSEDALPRNERSVAVLRVEGPSHQPVLFRQITEVRDIR